MKITKIQTDILRIPEDDPLADMPEEAGRFRPVVILRIQTDIGIEGIGLTFYGGAMTGTLHKAVEELGYDRSRCFAVGKIPGFRDYEAFLAEHPATAPEDRQAVRVQ